MNWRQTDTYWPQVPLTIAALLSHSGRAAEPWVTEGPSPLSGAGSHSACILSPTATGTHSLELQLTKPSVAPGYIIVWCPPAFFGRTHLHRIQPRPQVKVIFRYLRPDAAVSALPLIYTGASLDWWPGRGSVCNWNCYRYISLFHVFSVLLWYYILRFSSFPECFFSLFQFLFISSLFFSLLSSSHTFFSFFLSFFLPPSQLHQHQRVRSPLYKKCPRYDPKLYDGETSVLELWEMRNTFSLTLQVPSDPEW